MSSGSSCCDQNISCDSDLDQLNDDLVNDIERFAAYVERLRRSLDSSTSVPDGESMCVSVHSALSMVSQSVRDLLVRYPIFKTPQVLLPASQLVHSVKELNFDNSNIDSSRTLTCLDKLEAAVGNTLKQLLRHPSSALPVTTTVASSIPSKYCSATLGRKIKSSNNDQAGSGGLRNGRGVLTRRHSTYQRSAQDNEYDIDEIDKMVADRVDGIDIAFDRGKAWSKYCKELLNFVSRRVQLELDHAKKVHSLANQSKVAINEHFLPLRDVFESSFDNDVAFCERTYDAVKRIQDRFIKSLEMRRDDHERQRRALKNEWIRVAKQLKDTQQELMRARSLLDSRDDGYRRAQESFLRTESTGPAVGAEMIRRKKELERRRKNEEEALTKREEAQSQVKKLEGELERREQLMEDTKVRIVGQLRELVYRCDQTTKACSTHYFQALANLWVAQPGKYHEFADATRTYTPGAEYMSFLQNLPHRTVSSGSLFRTIVDNDEVLSSANHTASSSSVSSQRRNAIDVFDHEMILERKQKKSNVSVRLLDQSTTETNAQHTEAAKSHRLQRIRQPTKCSNCDTLSILSTVQCLQCGMVFHKSCLSKLTIFCGQSSKGTGIGAGVTGHSSLSGGAVENDYATAASRRMSIFGVSLKGHLDGQNRKVPLIVEKCVDELQRRGLKVKGIYRTCGVKSKIEQICEEFERSPNFVDIDLSVFHPMNIASVIKLYLRKLPEPLLTHELYNEWISLATGQNLNDGDEDISEQIRYLLNKLPEQNFNTLQFLLLHLNRVTWFEVDNLMTASNLGAVISPSMIWMHPYIPSCSNKNSSFLSDAHLLSKAVELLIKNAFEVFNVDRAEDWHDFFQNYPEIEQPPAVDPETEAHIGEGEDEDEDEDLLEDEADADVLCGGSFVPQPPTPDLLKNTLRGKNESYSTSDDLDLDSSLGSFVSGGGDGGHCEGSTTGPGGGCSITVSNKPQQQRNVSPISSSSSSCLPTLSKNQPYHFNINNNNRHNQLTSTLSTPLSLLTTKSSSSTIDIANNDNDNSDTDNEQRPKQSSFLQPQVFDASYCRNNIDKMMKDDQKKSLHQQQRNQHRQARSYTTSILVAPHSESHYSSNSTSTADNFIRKASPSHLSAYELSSNSNSKNNGNNTNSNSSDHDVNNDNNYDNDKNNNDSSKNVTKDANTLHASASGSSTFSAAATGIVCPSSVSSTLNNADNNSKDYTTVAEYDDDTDDNDLLSIVLSATDKAHGNAPDDRVNNKQSNASSCLASDVTFDITKGAFSAVVAATATAKNNKSKKTDNNGDGSYNDDVDQDRTDSSDDENDGDGDEAAKKSGISVELEINKESDKLRPNLNFNCHHKHYYHHQHHEDASGKFHCCLHKKTTTLLKNQVAVAEKRDESNDKNENLGLCCCSCYCCCDSTDKNDVMIRRDKKTLLQSPSQEYQDALAGAGADSAISRTTSTISANPSQTEEATATSNTNIKKNNNNADNANLDVVRLRRMLSNSNRNKDETNRCRQLTDNNVDNVKQQEYQQQQQQYYSSRNDSCTRETSSSSVYCNVHRVMNNADSLSSSCCYCCCCSTSSSRTTCTCSNSSSSIINTTPKQPNKSNFNVNVDICHSNNSTNAHNTNRAFNSKTQITTNSSSSCAKKCSVVSDDPFKNDPLTVHNSTQSDSTSPSSSCCSAATGGGDGGGSDQGISQSDKISLQSIRVLFTGTDVSYV